MNYKLRWSAFILVYFAGFSLAGTTSLRMSGDLKSKVSGLVCDICISVVTDLDSWLTSDTTEDQIADWVTNVCELISAISPDLVATCEMVLHAEIPVIIDNIVNNNLNPNDVCHTIGACS